MCQTTMQIRKDVRDCDCERTRCIAHLYHRTVQKRSHSCHPWLSMLGAEPWFGVNPMGKTSDECRNNAGGRTSEFAEPAGGHGEGRALSASGLPEQVGNAIARFVWKVLSGRSGKDE